MEAGSRISRLNTVITISGEISDAYAVTCEEYMVSMWPDFGLGLLDCIQDAALSEDRTAKMDTSDMHFKFECHNDTTTLRARGPNLKVLELFEAVTWLSTACRESPSASEIACCGPTLVRQNSKDLAFKVNFSCSVVRLDEVYDKSATCWHNMFRNPVIAKGFPIPRRRHGERGLELSLEMLAILGQTFWATHFDGFLLKGFNSVTTPVKRIGESVLWHFLVNKDGSRIHYCDAAHRSQMLSADEAVFAKARHFVGWTDRVEILAGEYLISFISNRLFQRQAPPLS